MRTPSGHERQRVAHMAANFRALADKKGAATVRQRDLVQLGYAAAEVKANWPTIQALAARRPAEIRNPLEG